MHEVVFQLSKIKVGHINESLKTKSIPTPRLLIKDHKNPNKNGKFPTRLAITATNFTATFEKIRISWSESTSQKSSGGLQKIHDNSSTTS